VDNPPTVNKVKAGSAIPVKFSLGGYQGMSIFSAGYPATSGLSCSSALTTDTIEETVTAGGSSLNYDSTSGQYIYVWKTDKAWAGLCKTLIVKLADGTTHTAYFIFTK
ncbi:MAG: PxKF domain-containing protein, partial [Actinomycetota bacterium]